MWKHDVVELCKKFWFVALEPKNLWSSETRKNVVLNFLDCVFISTEGICDDLAFFYCGSVIPELDVIKGISFLIKGNKTVLMARNSKCLDCSLTFF